MKQLLAPDYGYLPPHRTKTPCKNPVFDDKNLHRIAIIQHEHTGNKQDRDPTGSKGWITKCVCTGCGKEYLGRVFYLDQVV